MMVNFFRKPLNWLFTFMGLLIAASTAFAIFQPVQVIPRLALGPEYNLVDQSGDPITETELAGSIIIFGFGYINDPTDRLNQTLADLRQFERLLETENLEESVKLAIILFDDQRDTVEQRQAFSAAQNLNSENWLVLGGGDADLKQVIGQGFGIYYEAVPLQDLVNIQPELADVIKQPIEPDAYAFLQAERYVLIDNRNILRAEYRAPLDAAMAMRDVRYVIREKNSTGANRVLNEAAHLFLCYPQ